MHILVKCPAGQQWNECAFGCDDLCHSLEADLEDEGACRYNKQCVPGCVREVCQPPMIARDAETCVTPDKCTCRISSGYVLAVCFDPIFVFHLKGYKNYFNFLTSNNLFR